MEQSSFGSSDVVNVCHYIPDEVINSIESCSFVMNALLCKVATLNLYDGVQW